jgi:hypothetical protein
MSFLWPRPANRQPNVTVRIARILHWAAVGIALFGVVISFWGMSNAGDRELLPYSAVGLVWAAVAMIGRGLRYILTNE